MNPFAYEPHRRTHTRRRDQRAPSRRDVPRTRTRCLGRSAGGGRPVLTVKEVAQRVGLTQCAIYRAIQRGELPAYKPGGRLRIREADFEHWLESTRVPAPAAVTGRAAPGVPVASLELAAPRRSAEPSLRARVKASRGGRSAA